MTATSGPGISLYSENIGLAIMGEVPLVIINCQRLGPATGGATTVSQGDIQFMRWGTSGGYPIIVLAPASIKECYTLTKKAFDLSERFRVPVILATDKEMVSTNVTVTAESLEDIPVRQRPLAPSNGSFIPYQTQALDQVPKMSPFGGPHLLRFTTSSHDKHGYLTKNTQDIEHLNNHLYQKICRHLDEISMAEATHASGSNTLVIGYGIVASAILSAAKIANQGSNKVSTLIIRSLWPVPEEAIREALEGYKYLIVPELNHGQYRREIERLASPDQLIIGLNKNNGELITPEEILERLPDGK